MLAKLMVVESMWVLKLTYTAGRGSLKFFGCVMSEAHSVISLHCKQYVSSHSRPSWLQCWQGR